jgi:hypothetical protein
MIYQSKTLISLNNIWTAKGLLKKRAPAEAGFDSHLVKPPDVTPLERLLE